MTIDRNRTRPLVLLAPSLCAALALGCAEPEPEPCVSTEQFFKEAVWAPVMSQKCITCHNASGAAKNSQFVLQSSDWAGYLEANLATVERLSKLQYEGEPWILVKPTNTVEHGGGVQFERGSEEFEAFAELVERIQNPVVCPDETLSGEYFADVELLDELGTLRKAALHLAGRAPTAEEELLVAAGGMDSLVEVLDDMMHEEAFYDRLVELYNDHLLTDRYLPGTGAVDLLDSVTYPEAYWYEGIEDEAERNLARARTNEALAREALMLVPHVVRNDLPFTEILTADYTLVNPWSAQSYGAAVSFVDPNDPEEFVPATLPDRPHAGMLTSTMFLNRFPTTPTNRNRHRSRMVYKLFLATDVLALAERPIDPTSIEDFNPTRESETCTVCHANIDPIAGTLQNWDALGRYSPPEDGWYPEMFAPGFADAELPAGEKLDAAGWLADQIVDDPRFAASQVHIVFEGLTGQAPLREPSDAGAPDYLGKLTAFEAQNAELQRIAEAFIESGYDLRVVVEAVVLGPYFRAADFDAPWLSTHEAEGGSPAEGADAEAIALREAELGPVGTARWLTPEMLDRKISALFGAPWQQRVGTDNFLTRFDQYRIFYGGIDSDTIVDRMTEPNGIMVNVAERMANEVACWGTARDFTRQTDQRLLFPFVDPGFEPEDGNGFEIPGVTEAIRANIQHLHWHLLGERLELDDPELDRAYGLFLEVWRDGKRGLALDEYGTGLPGSCQATRDFWSDEELPESQRITQDPNYTIRAWMAVITYMLSDYRFLHE